jgi:formyltetrahydrofolate deformylase
MLNNELVDYMSAKKYKNISYPHYVLKVSCAGAVGIVAALGNFLSSLNCFITEMKQFDDLDTGRFFARIVFFVDQQQQPEKNKLSAAFEAIAIRFDMEWDLCYQNEATKSIIMVSKFDHCLEDILYRIRVGDLNMDVTAIISNHEDFKHTAERYKIPFYYLPITTETKFQQEAQVKDIIKNTKTDLVLLARYMQILSEDISAYLSGKCINIHHSFLPSFKGAKPYSQAYQRGVKLIGATAHYVTEDLDEGPIIEQMVDRVDHSMTPDDLSRIGRDLEAATLAKAIKYHIEHRVFMNNGRTVILK